LAGIQGWSEDVTAIAILAAALGIGDAFPRELGRMVDTAFQDHYDENRGRHAVIVPLHVNGTDVFQGATLEGDDARVIATASWEDRRFDETIPLADLWRLPAAGLTLEQVEPVFSATAVFGLAETVDSQGHLWASVLWDQRGAPVALLDPSTFNRLLGKGAEARRVAQVSGASGDTRPIAASTAQEYLAGQQDDLTDDGPRPLWWRVFRFETLSTAATNGLSTGPGDPRRYRLRTQVAGSIVSDATGRTKPSLKGSSWRGKPLAYVTRRRPDEIAWFDPTGDAGVELAERTQGTRVLDRLRAAGLTDRQAHMLASAEAGFSHGEIAQAFGCTVSTVKNTVRTARRKLERQT
jgi:DNA-binding CsgD family transcriptional regulator